jgi:hypothetical protein
MSTSQEAPALIQYACERCKTRFVLPPSSRKLNIAGKLRAFSMGVGRTFRLHEGLGASYDASRRQLLAKMDDEAYQSFVQSFRFCHECRQFVCNECWSTSRRSCLTCVAKSMTGTVRPRPPFAPTGPEIPRPIVASAAPRKGRLRRDLALIGLALAVIMVSLEAGILLVNATSGSGATATATPTYYAAVPTDTPTAVPSATDTASPAPSDSPSPSASPSPSPLASVTPVPVITPTPKPTPIPGLVRPTISCALKNKTNGLAYCHVTNGATYLSTDKTLWSYDTATGTGSTAGDRSTKGLPSANIDLGDQAAQHCVTLTVSRKGVSSVSSLASCVGG